MKSLTLLVSSLFIAGCDHEISAHQLKQLLPTCDDRGGIYSITTHPNWKMYSVRCSDDKVIIVNFEGNNN
jgi:hypothetical protein